MRFDYCLYALWLLSVLSIPSAGQNNNTDIDNLKKIIEKEIEIDYNEVDTIVPLFTIEHSENNSVLNNEKRETARFTFSIGYNLRFYLIGSSPDNNDLILRLHKYNEEDNVASELYFEFKDDTSDIKVSKHDHIIKSNTENILVLIIPENFKGTAVAVATEFWKK